VQPRAHVGVQLGEHARPQRLRAGDQQAIVRSHPEHVVQHARGVPQVGFDAFVSRALVVGLRPAPLAVAPMHLVAEGDGLAQARRVAARDARKALVHQRHAHAPRRADLRQRRDERSVRDHPRAAHRLRQAQQPRQL